MRFTSAATAMSGHSLNRFAARIGAVAQWSARTEAQRQRFGMRSALYKAGHWLGVDATSRSALPGATVALAFW
jgi:hypothetical protein